MNDIIVKPNILKLNIMKMTKNTYLCAMKNMSKIAGFLLMGVLLFPFHGSAQEYIKELYIVKTDTSIVRKYDNTYKLVYNEPYEHPSFRLFDNSGLSTTNMYLDSSFGVKDFEIDGTKVYFCGYRRLSEGTSTVAVFGFFDMDGFPNAQVYYYQHEEYVCFDQLEYYKIHTDDSTQLHVVLSAIDSNGDYHLIDSYETLYNRWMFWYMFLFDISGHKIRDLAVTSNYVVATTDKFVINNNNGYLWYLTRPAYIDGTIFDILVQYKSLPGFLPSGAKVEPCKNNWFVVAYCVESISRRIVAYDGTSEMYGLQFDGSYGTGIKDLKYNADNQETDVLITGRFKGYCQNSFYHFPTSVCTSGGIVYAHSHKEHSEIEIESFDYDGFGTFIASGAKAGILNLFHYKYDIWNGCFDKSEVETESFSSSIEPHQVSLDKGMRYYYRRMMNCSAGQTVINPLCE